MAARILKWLVLALVLAVLWMPLLQGAFTFIKTDPLKGAVAVTPDTAFSFRGWFSGGYQEQKGQYLNDTLGFRNLLVRLNNQVDFSLFSISHARDVLVGKKNYLYELNYIKAYYGKDFRGEDSIRDQVRELKFICDTLKKMGKDVIVVVSPGKGTFYPEYFPPRYDSWEKGETNYECYIRYLKEYGVPFIDFNGDFAANKGKSPYPLYPRYGIHWSQYGAVLAADSIVKFIRDLRQEDIAGITWSKIETAPAKDADIDISTGMNLLFGLEKQEMAYPEVLLEDTTGKAKPSMLVISDSFFWQLFNLGLFRQFPNSHFYFCNYKIFPESFSNPLNTFSIDYKKAVLGHDVIILMNTEATLPRFGYRFIEVMGRLLREGDENDMGSAAFRSRVDSMVTVIRGDAGWMELIAKKAKERGISTDSMLVRDAIYVLESRKFVSK